MRLLVVCCALAALAPAQASPAGQAVKLVTTEAPPGAYTIDKAHTSLNFRVNHLGFSHFTARFTRIDGTLQFDPVHPQASSVSVSIDPRSIQTNYPEPAKLDFDAQVAKEFLDVDHFPDMTFKSTRVDLTGRNTARITGDLKLHGVTHPVTLEATFNGGYAPNGMDPAGARIGFSAHGALKRSDFGISFGIPAPGSNMGVGDEVEIIIESELTKPKGT